MPTNTTYNSVIYTNYIVQKCQKIGTIQHSSPRTSHSAKKEKKKKKIKNIRYRIL
jgi:hypothetical protein